MTVNIHKYYVTKMFGRWFVFVPAGVLSQKTPPFYGRFRTYEGAMKYLRFWLVHDRRYIDGEFA